MIHFAWPWMALLAPLPWLLYRLRRPAQPQGATLFVPFAAPFRHGTARPARRGRGARSHCSALSGCCSWAPPRGRSGSASPVPVPTTGRRLLLAVDVSGSMGAEDMANGASRLEVVQRVAGRFVDERHGDRVGLILFGSEPYLQAPLTSDLSTVHQFLDEAVVGVAGTNTAIGDAIGLAIKRLRAEDRSASGPPPAGGAPHADRAASRNGADVAGAARTSAAHKTVLILLTDGRNDAGAMPPLKAADFAAEMGIRIYTIGVGPIAQQGFFGIRGNADLDEATLEAIAKATGGKYFRATDATALRAVYREINKLEPAAGRKEWLRPATEYFSWPLGLALLLSLPGAVWLGERVWA